MRSSKSSFINLDQLTWLSGELETVVPDSVDLGVAVVMCVLVAVLVAALTRWLMG